jgi:tight adherence protein C
MFVFQVLPVIPMTAGVFVLVLVVMLLVMAPGESGAASTRVHQYTTAGLPGSPGAAVEVHGVRERLMSPLVRRILEFASQTAPKRVRKATAADLAMAGSSMSPTMFLGVRGLVMFGLPLLTGVYVLSVPERTMVQWGLLGMTVIWGRKLPGLWLRRRIKARQKTIDRALPYALDLMVACLEGGLSLDATLAKVAEQSNGALSEEIQRTLQEMTLGRPGAEALRDLGDRTGAPDLKRLTENVVQAERMGISITETMRTLAADSRVRRRQRAEEMARKAPIKMVPVLIFCILPALAAVVMTPAVLIMIRVFQESIQT